jgi:hypothetical protein
VLPVVIFACHQSSIIKGSYSVCSCVKLLVSEFPLLKCQNTWNVPGVSHKRFLDNYKWILIKQNGRGWTSGYGEKAGCSEPVCTCSFR